eukprot:m.158610 g.158610  ORF g.158610 m.158610 type:complete len:199 (-) comp52998_c0_seq1:708-1304(-)
MAAEPRVSRVGSRDSKLAMVQTNLIVDALKALHADVSFPILSMKTIGDIVLDKPLSRVGEKSLFTKELEQLLAEKMVDFVVHSLKDLPTVLPEGMCIAAMCEREDARDAVIFHSRFPHDVALATLPPNSVVGTSSLRRISQLSLAYPHLRFENVRGNLNTRLEKLERSTEDGSEGQRSTTRTLVCGSSAWLTFEFTLI